MSEDNKDFSVAGLAKEFVNSKSESFEVAANEM